MEKAVKTKVVPMEIQNYIKNNFVYDNGNIFRLDKKDIKTGSLDKDGYLIIKIKGKQYKAHQISWFLNKGEFAGVELDHINKNKLDNRIENLRIATRVLQNRNKKAIPNKDTGVVGIYMDNTTKGLKKKYTFKLLNKSYRFYTLEEAIEMKKKLIGE